MPCQLGENRFFTRFSLKEIKNRLLLAYIIFCVSRVYVRALTHTERESAQSNILLSS